MNGPLQVLCVIGTSGRDSATHVAIRNIARRLVSLDARVDVLDPVEEPLPLFNPESSHLSAQVIDLKTRVERADVYVLGTPDYHGSVSSTLKNFLDHFWREFAGKLFGDVVCSNEKGLTVIDQLRTVARQCYAWTLPYGLSFANLADVNDGAIVSESFDKRVDMFVHDLQKYGLLLRDQRRAALDGSFPSFLERHRAHKASLEPHESSPIRGSTLQARS